MTVNKANSNKVRGEDFMKKLATTITTTLLLCCVSNATYALDFNPFNGFFNSAFSNNTLKVERVFEFSPKHLRWRAYKNGRLVRSGRASGGRGYCPDIRRSCRTPPGHFRVYRKQGPGCRSSKYPRPRGGAKMPYCMHYYRGYAIHGSHNVPNYNASHGCIRVIPSDAKWLNHNFMKIGTRVIVKSY